MEKKTSTQMMYDALRVIAGTPAIRRALAVTDMKALIQVDAAINAADMHGGATSYNEEFFGRG